MMVWKDYLNVVGQPTVKTMTTMYKFFKALNPAVEENIVKAEGFLYV